jgi:Ser/Thr protein kinase RdoA (MazF antagonist)
VIAEADAGAIARIFGLGDGAALTGTIARGEQGLVAQLATSRGMWAVKTSFPGTPADLDGEDVAFQTAARAAGVPAPMVGRTVDGAPWADVGGVPVRLYEWVDVLPTDRSIDPARVGWLMAAIHGVPFAGRRPQDGWYSEPVGADGWDALIAALVAAGAPFAGDLAAVRDELVALEALLEPAAHLRTCHRDLWADNVRGTAAGGLCVIDWDNCGLADPSQELAVALFEFAAGDRDRARELYREYRHCGGPGRVARRGDFSMAIAQLGHITEISCRHWLDPPTSPAEREHHAARVRESVEDPLTVEAIDALLDSVGSGSEA